MRTKTRRRFVQGLAIGGAAAGLGLHKGSAWSAGQAARPAELSGTSFDLRVGESVVNYTGQPARALTVNGQLPAPLLRWREGDTATLRVRNELRDEPTAIHWHGLLLPANMDGVPGLSFAGISPGDTYVYRFDVRQSGTYWYHSHHAFQEQKGVYGPIVIEPREPAPVHADREHVILLSDWTDESGERIYSKLKKQSHYYNHDRRTLLDFIRDVRGEGWNSTVADRLMWGRMRMDPTDLADVSAYTYTHLINGTTPAGNWTALYRPGERVRLRFINGSSMTYFDVRIPGLRMTVVAADGQYVHPVSVDEFRIAVAETLDVIVEPTGQDAWTIFAQSMDRTGYARGTLAVRPGLTAPVPEPDARVLLSMADMGMAGHEEHDGHAEHQAHATADAHAGHDAHDAHGDRGDHGAGGGHGDHGAGGRHGASGGHGGHGGHEMPASVPARPQAHPPSERGNPLVDGQVQAPTSRLDDPGIGLRDNGRRVLTYADLHSVFADPDGREPSRTIELHLTGHMDLYAWSFDGVKFSDAAPLSLHYGERVRIVLVNDTMMAHPIHLHGMWSDLEDDRGRFMVRKHTVDIPPGSRRSYRVTADALGRWAYHCHLLYHMEAGMFREVRVEE